ncbi:MAG TPA: hypothetical protein VGQ75_10400 [Thermoanaerobaculia bacterium]|jgi:hypothetical protein|nr:hypothetical protein [Thermoanaerobaculia bacterium]HEV8608865.1 hypothetical protein [Thermoanaerobaculia bacterium]
MNRKKKAAVSSHGPQGTNDVIRLARPAETPDLEPVEDFLTDVLEPADEELVRAAWKRFPEPDPPDTYLRPAFAAIGTAQAYSTSAAENLEQLRRIAYSDPEELEDSVEGWTIVEGGLERAADDLEEARRECRRAIAMLRRTRSRRQRPRRILEIVS